MTDQKSIQTISAFTSLPTFFPICETLAIFFWAFTLHAIAYDCFLFDFGALRAMVLTIYAFTFLITPYPIFKAKAVLFLASWFGALASFQACCRCLFFAWGLLLNSLPLFSPLSLRLFNIWWNTIATGWVGYQRLSIWETWEKGKWWLGAIWQYIKIRTTHDWIGFD